MNQYTVDIYVGKNIVSSILVQAEDKKSAVELAVKQTSTKVTKGRKLKKD